MFYTPIASASRVAIVAGLLVVPWSAAGAEAPWLGPAWSRRVLFTATADSIEGAGELANFPMLVRLGTTQATVFAQANTDGRDLRFTSADGVTPLDAEIVHFDAANQQAEIWVRATTLSKTANRFFLYYGNRLAASASTCDVWADYKAVYHFEQDAGTGTLLDSSPAQAHATTVVRDAARWTAADRVAAKIGHGWHYDTNKTVITNQICVSTPAWTVSAWLKHDTHGTDFFMQSDPCFFHLTSQASDLSWDVQYQGGHCGAPPDYRWRQGGVVLNEWHQFAWVYDGARQQITFYYDGIADVPFPIYPAGAAVYGGHSLNPDGTSFVSILGPMWANGVDEMNGTGDEFRLRPGTRTAAWMRTEFRNQNAPQQFFVFGQEQALADATASWGGFKRRY